MVGVLGDGLFEALPLGATRADEVRNFRSKFGISHPRMAHSLRYVPTFADKLSHRQFFKREQAQRKQSISDYNIFELVELHRGKTCEKS